MDFKKDDEIEQIDVIYYTGLKITFYVKIFVIFNQYFIFIINIM